MTDKTYECEICHGINSAVRLHCQNCGTIPARYSILRKPAKLLTLMAEHHLNPSDACNTMITVHIAFGCERQVSRRTIKRTARTVPLDYYAQE